jgi:hemolysin III
MPSVAVRTHDARRDSITWKPLLRGWLHLVWFEAALVLGTVVVMTVEPSRRPVAAICAASFAALFGTSALYHRGTWRPRAHRLLQRADHAMIFVLIAGTATPVFWLAVPHPLGTVLLIVLWALTGAALLTHMIWMHAPEWLVGSTFIALGCAGIAALPAVWVHAGVVPFSLFLGGGVLYILGAVLYHVRRPDPWPTVYGFHEVFHTFVCCAAALQYFAIARYIL